ncbi:MAG: patatin-like phospholipase family protein, partial [Planctomycetota bacterium]
LAGQEGAAPRTGAPGSQRPKIGLVLGGGGARGCAHAGVIKVLEELRIPIYCIAGTSMGSIVGAAYAYGHSPARMRRELIKDNWDYVLQDDPHRQTKSFRRKQDDLNFLFDIELGYTLGEGIKLKKGLVQGQNIDIVFKKLVFDAYKIQDFDELPIPYRAVAADIGTGEVVVLGTGELVLAMRASMAFPGAFRPVTIQGRELVDGGIVNNVPISVVQDMGADVVIAVDVGTPLMDAKDIASVLQVTEQMVGILMKKNVDEQVARLTDKDVLIRPDLGDMSVTQFKRSAQAMDIGEAAARAVAEKLRRYSVSEAEWAAYVKRQRRQPEQMPVIGSIRIVSTSDLSLDVIRAHMRTKVGEVLDLDKLQQDLERIYGLEDFELVTFYLRELESGTELSIRARGKSWGPDYLRFGLNLADDFDGENQYTLGLQYTMRELNRLGAEWRNEIAVGEFGGVRSEFYQPLDAAGRYFVAPEVKYRRFEPNVFQGGSKVAEFQVQDWTAALDVGRQLGNWGELRFGVARQWGKADPQVSSIPTKGFHFDDAGLFGRFAIDTLDDPNFPRTGTLAGVVWFWANEEMGADDEYQIVDTRLGHAVSWGKTTAVLTGAFQTVTDGDRPLWRRARVGGFLRLSGLVQDELTGQHSGRAGLILYRQIFGTRQVMLGMPVYVGGSIETGGVWDDRDDIGDDLIMAGSAWLGVDSPIGAVYLGYGMAEGGDNSVYLFVGSLLGGARGR